MYIYDEGSSIDVVNGSNNILLWLYSCGVCGRYWGAIRLYIKRTNGCPDCIGGNPYGPWMYHDGKNALTLWVLRKHMEEESNLPDGYWI